MKDTLIISAFPACGKTYCFKNKEENISILDSDSSKFSWSYEPELEKDEEKGNVTTKVKKRNPDFPNNYIEHIKENIGKVDYIFVSTHDVVRKALNDAGIEYVLVFPEYSLKEEWVGRCFLRGSDEKFCHLIADKWDEWLSELEEECALNNRDVWRLEHGQYISDIVAFIEKELKERREDKKKN